jgi:hypothetical protein
VSSNREAIESRGERPTASWPANVREDGINCDVPYNADRLIANSIALGRWLRRMRPQVGFLLTSGTQQTAAESQEWGLLLSKPYRFSDLSHHLRSILGRYGRASVESWRARPKL